VPRADLLDCIGAGLGEHQIVEQLDRIPGEAPVLLGIMCRQEPGYSFPRLERGSRLEIQEAFEAAAIRPDGIRRIPAVFSSLIKVSYK
jgi:hypothetical protein